jgi:two-component system sensor histidine kinase KdpD
MTKTPRPPQVTQSPQAGRRRDGKQCTSSVKNALLREAMLESLAQELRTPLTSILGAITSLRSMASLDHEQREELMAVIEEETRRLNCLIGQAVDMEEVDSKETKPDLPPTPFES